MTGIKKTILYFFSAASFLFFSLHLFAQSVNKPYFHFKNFNTSDGLISNNTTTVFKDSRGFLWIGTDRGLQRFNGSSFLTFRHLNNDSNSIVNENITFIAEDSKHDIWVATTDGIVKFSYANGKLTNYAFGFRGTDKIRIGDLLCIFEDSRKRIWAGARSGLYLLDTIKNQFMNCAPVNIPGMNLDHFIRVHSVKETANKEIIFSVIDGFVIMDKDGRQQYFQMPAPSIKPINYIPTGIILLLKDHPDEVWVAACLNGFFKYERSSGKWTNYRSGGVLGNDLVKACTDWNKDEWILGGDNICFFNHRTGTFTKAADKIGSISSMYRESNGNIWLSSSWDGIHLLNLSTQLFSSVQYIPGAGSDKLLYYDKGLNAVYAMNIYFVTGIVKQDLSSNQVTHDSIAAFTAYTTVMNNFIADHDTLYLAMEKGLWRYDLQKHRLDSIVFNAGNSSSQEAFFFNLCQSGNKIYFTGKFSTGGPFVYDRSTQVVKDLALIYKGNNQPGTAGYYPSNVNSTIGHGQVNAKDLPLLYKKNNEPNNYGFCLTLSDHVLYTGMNLSDTIYTYDENTGLKNTIAIPSDYINGKTCSISALCVDGMQNLWCGTGGDGILVYNIRSQKWIQHISQDDGYFPVLTSEIVSDEDGVVWCNTSEGLFSFNPDNFHFKNYSLKDGLRAENNSGNIALLPGHRLMSSNVDYSYYDFTYGIIYTKPANTAVQIIPVSITNLKVLGEDFLTDTLLDNMQQITLLPNKNAFSLNYAGIDLTNGSKLLYSYMLEGAEKKWHEAGKEQSLSYINLSPGKYVLHVKCKSRDEMIVSKERIIYINVLPAWYQTYLFKILMILVIALLVFAAIRYYLRQQLKKQQAILENEKALTQERNRIAADMHDDVGAGLSRIRYITASMKDRKGMNEEDIDKIVSLSDESVEKMNEIIWALNQGNQQLDELIYYTRSQCSEMLNNAGLQFSFELPENIPNKILGWKDCRNIYLLVKESVNNAIKHAGANNIIIECIVTDQLQFSITDNGKGFDPASIKDNGNGLLNYKKRTEKINGTYQLITSAGKGTQIIFTLPVISIN
ncbi:MAG: triple tyrosine motif-containing protein [Ferruginibacter sp.]